MLNFYDRLIVFGLNFDGYKNIVYLLCMDIKMMGMCYGFKK